MMFLAGLSLGIPIGFALCMWTRRIRMRGSLTPDEAVAQLAPHFVGMKQPDDPGI